MDLPFSQKRPTRCLTQAELFAVTVRMAFVKLDRGILTSTIWCLRPDLEIFVTALLMGEPREYPEPVPTIKIDSLEDGGWTAPPGWYGFVPAAGPGIVRAAHVDDATGIEALKRLASPEPSSRSQEFEGRRMVRINGGFLVLNYMKYRDYDHSAADRMRRLRERRKQGVTPNAVTVQPNVTHSRGQRTEADNESEGPTGQTETKPKAPPRIPTMAEWCERAKKEHPDWPTADAESAWRHYESQGWKRGNTLIVKWSACVATCYANWKKRGVFHETQTSLPRIPENLQPGYSRD